MKLRSIKDANIQPKIRVLLRADFDVVLQNGRVQDDFRIQAMRDTVDFILKHNGKLRIIAHLGRPKGRNTSSISLKKLQPLIERIFGITLTFIPDPFDVQNKKKFEHWQDALLFENIRFWPGEEEDSLIFAKNLAFWGDIYINEAFAVTHRKHASVHTLATLLPSFAGFHLIKEVTILSPIAKNPEQPFVALLGGEKSETKIQLIEKFLQKKGKVFVGGTLMNTLLRAREISVGKSIVDEVFVKNPNRFILTHKNLFLPSDAVVAKGLKSHARVVDVHAIKNDEIIFDVGPESIEKFLHSLNGAHTIVWNGPLGSFEYAPFAKGTIAAARGIQKAAGFTVVGGGHTIAALRRYGLLMHIDHISTGGGAMLEFLTGKKLPGIEVLEITQKTK